MKKNYKPYGPEWKKALNNLPKEFTINLFAKLGVEHDKALTELSNLKFLIEEYNIKFKPKIK